MLWTIDITTENDIIHIAILIQLKSLKLFAIMSVSVGFDIWGASGNSLLNFLLGENWKIVGIFGESISNSIFHTLPIDDFD